MLKKTLRQEIFNNEILIRFESIPDRKNNEQILIKRILECSKVTIYKQLNLHDSFGKNTIFKQNKL